MTHVSILQRFSLVALLAAAAFNAVLPAATSAAAAATTSENAHAGFTQTTPSGVPTSPGKTTKGTPFGLTLSPAAPAESEEEVTPGILADREAIEPGGQLILAFILDHQPEYHSQARAEELTIEGLIPTSVNPSADNEAVTFGPVQWPESKSFPVDLGDGPIDAPTYGGRAVFLVPVAIAPEVIPGGQVTFTLDTAWQACNSFFCLPPDGEILTITLPVVETGSASALPSAGADFQRFDPAVFADISSWTLPSTAATTGSTFFGVPIPRAEGLAGIVLVAALAILGGFVLNLTPCVLPVIPIKVMTISHHAGSPGKSLMLGLWMFLGVVAFWFGIGLPVALVSGFADPSMLFGIWWVTLSIGLLIAVMGVGIMGAFSIELPSNVSAISPKADSPVGSFLFGVMTAVLGLPCFGFVAGALLAGTATMPWWLVLTIFTAIGAGMGLPYLVLAAKPEWVNKIPRTGPASELVKQVMGLLLLAAAAYFIGSGVLALVGPQDLPWWGKIIHWWGVALFAAAAGLWLITRTLSISKNAAMRAAMAVIALVLGTGGVAAATSQTDKARNDFWLPYSEDALNARLAGGDVVVLDFTAEWCLNCKALEAAVLGVDPVKPLLLSTGVVPFKADLTRSDAPGWDKLTALGKTGIPTLAVFGPGTAEPWIANAYTSREVVDAIERAKGQ